MQLTETFDLRGRTERWTSRGDGPTVARRGRTARLLLPMAQADQAYTDAVQPRYGELDLPVLVVWGREDTWIPVDRAHRLAPTIPGAELGSSTTPGT